MNKLCIMEDSRGNIRTIIIILLLAFILIGFVLFLQQAAPNSISRSAICGDQLSSCRNQCSQKFISYFCNKDCDKGYGFCMGQ